MPQELEFLADSSAITSDQLSSIMTQLPSENGLNASRNTTPAPVVTGLATPPTSQFANTSLNEKNSNFYAPIPSPALAPPAYPSVPAVPSLASASALYEYHPSDAGDLALMPNDRIAITEFMNADWAKGRNERTGQEGIFPRSYVNVIDEKNSLVPPPPGAPSSYGNMPVDVSQTGGGATPGGSKVDANGKKFG